MVLNPLEEEHLVTNFEIIPAEGDKPAGSVISRRISNDPLESEILQPLPEKIDYSKVPKIQDTRSIWRIGMRKLEEVFAEHVANLHLDFDDRLNQF